MTKSELRKKYKALRQQLSSTDIEDKSLAIANQLLQLDIWNALFYHVFLTIETQHEVNTDYILNILSGKDKNIVISKSNFTDFSMTHYLLTDNTRLQKNTYNIPEPIDGIEIQSSQLDVVFIPLLAFDNKGNRVGYGKGFYDRFLADCKPETIKIGLSFFEAENEIIETLEDDVKLDYCVTPEKLYRF
ncbi:5-formyltetrahydrofolate cyclo-ligase [Winogradskyella immobilis]|uniref:5-formyltetrahydrofolate cyclo-ligase n=1 Tax=Winogradskyella immobilis TaxID=2816852 RepID=A0ABS8EQ10_9FLAO|nr:5-formyltetrahydrofolate cyclo-ligase [Winogradskyella immobilis]MCC1485309.1 5-formyltetrahydrofolate cyclo-ligase [Winogradskyella immobilis]MCG0017401.1 5-formyltetrahydrofolate cyclo-ligase [Winogradskyella immobilis]